MKTLILILQIITAPIWVPLWLQLMLIKKCWKLLALLLAAAIVSGCASNSAKLDLSPCAGCDFHPVNTIPVATTPQSTALRG